MYTSTANKAVASHTTDDTQKNKKETDFVAGCCWAGHFILFAIIEFMDAVSNPGTGNFFLFLGFVFFNTFLLQNSMKPPRGNKPTLGVGVSTRVAPGRHGQGSTSRTKGNLVYRGERKHTESAHFLHSSLVLLVVRGST